MINFHGITHVISNPSGHAPGYNYSLVGAVPTSLLEPRIPTTADVMAGRVQSDGFAYGGRRWETIAQIVTEARAHQVTLCTSATCTCRQLFPSPMIAITR